MMSGWHRGPFPRAHLTGDIMPRDAGAFSPVRGSRSGLAGEIMESTKKGLTMRNDHTIGRRAVLAAAAALPFLLSMPAWARAEAPPLAVPRHSAALSRRPAGRRGSGLRA